MARIGFGTAALASLVFAAWFLFTEMESPGLSFAVALIGMPLLAATFGFTKIKGDRITHDGKGAGWAAFGIALLGAGYVALFFGSWLIMAIVWLALLIPMVVAVVLSPTAEG